jgi:hypothetical protein
MSLLVLSLLNKKEIPTLYSQGAVRPVIGRAKSRIGRFSGRSSPTAPHACIIRSQFDP